ncbi:hypothetical protein BCR33DRAFT_377596 [Rhizoclosmatium globosum]|uniref:Uncharacterized protein n=1 Tax=Rhizoclosmatium globosum TaxID=329046 RepID=A0A1Y2BYQ4_9FUNG|nr:hypothetical protein BCR33DRAFT_377596 [Rhizoclosmatium globosum]|eukprot:ORY39881.1 hypothetical protein BCR33DRAFT_377596 [Rhizoclosmatium globosum]
MIRSYRNVIPEKYELSSSIKDFVGNKSRFVGKWKRYVNSMSATADSRRLAKSQSYHAIVQELGPILHFLQEFMRRYLPGLYSHFKRTRKLFNNYVATVTKNPLMYQTQTPLSSTEIDVLSEDFMGIFTLFCLGHNSGRSEDIHVDGNNMQYGYNLLVPFGSFHGGVMQLPEVGVEIELMDRDLFVFDAVFYKHTLTKVIGERYSLIAFECRLAVKQMYEFNHITEASMAVGRYVDDNWFKHVGLTRRFNPLQTAV